MESVARVEVVKFVNDRYASKKIAKREIIARNYSRRCRREREIKETLWGIASVTSLGTLLVAIYFLLWFFQ